MERSLQEEEKTGYVEVEAIVGCRGRDVNEDVAIGDDDVRIEMGERE